MVDRARHDEQQIGQPVDVSNQDRVDRRLQRHHPPFGTAADRPRQCSARARLDAAGENEVRERRQLALEPIDQLLEPLDIGVSEAPPS